MEVIRDTGSMRALARSLAGRPEGGAVGFVPTLGYLHEGHLSLVRRAREECSSVVVSIFLNPLQFGPSEDLARYPRDEERDLGLARGEGISAVFLPPVEEVYPEGFTTEVRVPGLEDKLEGATRPGHFAGVATVLAKLLNVVGPDRMYLGQKDAQQAVLVRRMMLDLGFPTSLVVCPTVREPDGLAMSSRNVYLSPEEREAASAIPRALSSAAAQAENPANETNETNETPAGLAERLRERAKRELSGEVRLKIEYVSADDADTLEPVADGTQAILLSCAVRLGGTRLIDNVVLDLA